jgi:hypothetical protein
VQTILKFEVAGETDREAVEADVALAIFAAECIYGKPRTRIETSFLVDQEGQACVIRAEGEAGEAAARIFAGLTAARLGEGAYAVRVLERGVRP